MPPPFERTICACLPCTYYCYRQPGHMLPEDVAAIARHLVERGEIRSVEEVHRYLQASKGAVVADSRTGRVFRIGTITPRMEDGRCVFLENDRCRVHPVAPFGCAYFDSHMSAAEGARRSSWGLRVIQVDQTYRALRAELAETFGETDPLETRQQEPS